LSGCHYEQVPAETYGNRFADGSYVVECNNLLEEIEKRITSLGVREVGDRR
jgi:hypothetical protein